MREVIVLSSLNIEYLQNEEVVKVIKHLFTALTCQADIQFLLEKFLENLTLPL